MRPATGLQLCRMHPRTCRPPDLQAVCHQLAHLLNIHARHIPGSQGSDSQGVASTQGIWAVDTTKCTRGNLG